MIRRDLGWAVFAAAVATTAALLLDPWTWHHLRMPAVYDRDWGRLFRVFGTLYFWGPLAIAVWLEGRPRAWLLVLGPLLAGGGAELIKILVRRERPALHDGGYVFRAFADRPFDTHDIGFPSSHVMVAFAGAAGLARLFPRTAPVASLLAAGCGLSRVLAQAHFASDVMAGGIAGWAVATMLWRRVDRSPDTSRHATV